MDNQHREFRIGITVFVALAFLVILIVFFGKAPTMNFGDEYTVRVRFQRTPGISRNTPVFKNGVRIGRVQRVELIDMDREVEVTILLSKKRKIYTNEQCRIRQTVIMGEASMEFVKIANYTGPVQEIDPDQPQDGYTPADFMSGFAGIEGEMTQAIQNVSKAANEFHSVAGQVGDMVDKVNMFIGTPEELQARLARLEALADESQATMRSFRLFSEGAHAFFNDPAMQREIRKIIAAMPDILDRSKTLVSEAESFVKEARALMVRGGTTLGKVDGSLDMAQQSMRKIDVSLDKVATSLDKAGAAVDSIKKVTDSIEGDVPEIIASLKKSAAKLDSFFDEITMLVQGIRNADGTIMRLIKDPEMHDKLLTTIDNIEQLTDEVNRMIRTDFKPIANNVKVLTDKAARDPGVFIRGLIRKQPPIKGGMPVWGDGLGSDTLGDLSCGLERFHRESYLYESVTPETILESPGIETIPEMPTLAPEIHYENEGAELPNAERKTFGDRISSLLPRFGSAWPSFKKAEIETLQEPIPLGSGAEESVPEEGRIIHVDPRYTTANNAAVWQEPVYRQMSYTSENDDTPKLRFAK